MTLVGTALGPIQLIDVLGQGGMGEVYLGYDRKLERKVAVKAIRQEHQLDDKAKSRMLREAKMLSRLEHPNICRLYDLVEAEQGDFLIMEFVSGVNLQEAIKSGISQSEKLRIAVEIVGALAVAHEQIIVHRDLKPENVMMTQKGQIKILDFGVARNANEVDSGLLEDLPFGQEDISDDMESVLQTQMSTIVGTPWYMSPEQAMSEPPTTASDMYSLGLLFQELFTGRGPYSPEITMESLLWKAMNADSLPVEGLSSDLTRLINRMKAKVPTLRPSAVETENQLNWIIAKPLRRTRSIVLAAFLLLLVLGTTLSTIGFYRAKRSEHAAQQTSVFLSDMLVKVDPRRTGIDLKVVDMLDDAEAKIDRDFAGHPLIRANLHHTFGRIFVSLGGYTRAHTHAERALEIYRAHLGEEHPATLDAKNNLATAIFRLGRLEQAEALFREVAKTRSQTLGADHPDTLQTMSDLGIILANQGQFEEAESIHRDVVEKEERRLGNDHPDTLISTSNLAQTLMARGRYAQARELQQEVVSKSHEVFGASHPDTLTAMANLATILSEMTQYQEAEELQRIVLEKESQVLGADHPATMVSMGNLANTLSKLNRNDEAEQLLREVVKHRKRDLGLEHPHTLISISNLATILSNQNRDLEAEKLQLELVNGFKRVSGPDHPNTVIAMSNLAKTIWKLGRFEEAEQLQREVVEKGKQSFGPEHPNVKRMLERLADMQRKLNQSANIEQD